MLLLKQAAEEIEKEHVTKHNISYVDNRYKDYIVTSGLSHYLFYGKLDGFGCRWGWIISNFYTTHKSEE